MNIVKQRVYAVIWGDEDGEEDVASPVTMMCEDWKGVQKVGVDPVSDVICWIMMTPIWKLNCEDGDRENVVS